MSTTIVQQACECGQTFETEHDPNWKMLTEKSCPSCRERQEAEWQEEQARQREERDRLELESTTASNQKAAASVTPDRILETNLADRRFNAGLWEKVTLWKPTSEKPWLGLIGDPGECKTRCAFLRLMQFAREDAIDKRRFSCAAITGMDFAKLVAQQFDRTEVETLGSEWRQIRTTRGSVASTSLDALRNASVLVFDELGKVKSSPGTMDELFGLIDYRHAHNLATIWTSNTTPEKFCTGWPEEYSGPACGRILESSTILRA